MFPNALATFDDRQRVEIWLNNALQTSDHFTVTQYIKNKSKTIQCKRLRKCAVIEDKRDNPIDACMKLFGIFQSERKQTEN